MKERFDQRYITSQPGSVQPRLWRSRDNRVFAGVVGGLAERMNVNPTMLRWFSAFAAVMTGFMPGIVFYLILWAITSLYPSDAKPR